jgi:hypothetical protein
MPGAEDRRYKKDSEAVIRNLMEITNLTAVWGNV